MKALNIVFFVFGVVSLQTISPRVLYSSLMTVGRLLGWGGFGQEERTADSLRLRSVKQCPWETRRLFRRFVAFHVASAPLCPENAKYLCNSMYVDVYFYVY